MAKQATPSSYKSTSRVSQAASEVLRNPASSKSAKTAAGSALTQRPDTRSPKSFPSKKK